MTKDEIHEIKAELDRPRHPSTTSVAATFLDILFGVLLGIIVLEFQPSDFLGKAVDDRALFGFLYSTLLLKFFFHWWGNRSDVAVFSEFFDYNADIRNYLSGIFVALTYFACIRLVVTWFKEPKEAAWALRWLFGVLAGFKVVDTVTNLTAVRSLVKQLTGKNPTDQVKQINDWYLEDQPRIVWWFLVSVPFLFAAAFSKRVEVGYVAVVVFLVVEALVERKLFLRRLGLWRQLHPRPHKAAPA